MAASQEPSTLQGNVASEAVTTALFKNFANSDSGMFQPDSWFLVLSHGQCLMHGGRVSKALQVHMGE